MTIDNGGRRTDYDWFCVARVSAVRYCFLPVLVAILALSVRARLGNAQDDLATFQWEGVLAPGRVVEIKGVHGTIQARRSSGDKVLITATRHAGQEGLPQAVRVEAITHDEGVTVCALYPTEASTVDPGMEVTLNRCVAGGRKS